VSDFRGYDPSLERLDLLRSESLAYSPVCGEAVESFQALHPKEWMRIEHQKSWPSCGGHALSTVMEWLFYLASQGEVLQLSRFFAWVQAQKSGGGRPSASRGVSIYGCAKAAKEVGLPEEDLAPYKVGDFRTEFPPEVYENAKEHKAINSIVLETADECFDFLAGGVGGICFGVPWEFNMRSWHAVAGVGVPTDGTIHIANSWGPDWDGDGWTEWDHDKLTRYLKIDGSVAIGLTDMDRPHVRKGWLPERGGFA